MTITTTDSPTAVSWDLENMYWLLHHQQHLQPKDTLLQVMRDMRHTLEQQLTGSWVMQTAYADFEAMPEPMQGDLSLIGISAVNVLKTPHKNSADMRLAIDALATLYERPWIRTHVIVSGDRDFIPLVDHLRRSGIDVRVASFTETLAGDLRTVAGADHLIDASAFIPQLAAAPDGALPLAQPCGGGHAGAGQLSRNASALLRFALDKYVYGRNLREIHLGPLKRAFSEHYPNLSSPEVGAAVTELINKEVVRLEKREGVDLRNGEPIQYSVVLPNWDHPLVEEANRTLGTDPDSPPTPSL